MPSLSNWVAPTLNLEELEKRIGELKAVHFWLDQNSKALGATIQALEVQKMTLATLKGMNFNMGEVANAFKLKTAETRGDRRAEGQRAAARHGRRDFRRAQARAKAAAKQGREGRRTGRGRRRRSAAVVGRAHPAVPADRSRRHEGRGSQDGRRHGQATWQPARPRKHSRRPAGCQADAATTAGRARKTRRQARRAQEASRPIRGSRRHEALSLRPRHPSAVADGGRPGAGATARADGAARLRQRADAGPALHHRPLRRRRRRTSWTT